uniref:Uncharacterized protein n=1 Tax=Rousettus aegyptiacus TaxID=9407 RepID=A0A7J8DXZ1_ROUAE|nr:hypothetical protein HJG63_008372 [Rousettus aegyptiacus]
MRLSRLASSQKPSGKVPSSAPLSQRILRARRALISSANRTQAPGLTVPRRLTTDRRDSCIVPELPRQWLWQSPEEAGRSSAESTEFCSQTHGADTHFPDLNACNCSDGDQRSALNILISPKMQPICALLTPCIYLHSDHLLY